MGINIGKLDTALDRAVEAAVDPSLWGDVLDRVAEATGAFGVNIVPIAGSFPGGLIMTDSLQPALEGYFDGGWNKNEWRRRGLPLLSRQGTVLEQHYTTRDEFTDEEYYRAQSKYGLGRTCIVGLSSPSDLVCFTLHRRLDEDPFDVEDETVFRAMRDRLMVSAQIMWNAGAHRIEGMLEAFQMARIGAVFFDRFGKVRSTNAAAERMLGNELQISGGELRSKVHAETVRIRQRMKAILTESWLDPRLAEPIQIHREAARPILLRIQRLGGNSGRLLPLRGRLPDGNARPAESVGIDEHRRSAGPDADASRARRNAGRRHLASRRRRNAWDQLRDGTHPSSRDFCQGWRGAAIGTCRPRRPDEDHRLLIPALGKPCPPSPRGPGFPALNQEDGA